MTPGTKAAGPSAMQLVSASPPHPSLEKPVPGAEKVGNRCSKALND